MAILIRRNRWLAGVAALLIISAAWAQSRGTSEDESAVRALIQGADGDDKNATKAKPVRGRRGLDEFVRRAPTRPGGSFAEVR